MKILIFGGNGYVGSALYKSLYSKYDVTSIDLCVFGKNLGHSLIQDVGKINDSILQSYDVIIMLSAHSSVPLCISDPTGAIKNNVTNLLNIAKILNSNQKFIYASSTSCYGQSTYNAAENQTSYQLHNWYDVTKTVTDEIVQSMIAQGASIVGLRFGTVCGVSDNTRNDLFINSMIYGIKSNKEYWVANSQSKRSVLAINDAVTAITQLISGQFISGIYNLKSFDCSIADVANILQERTGIVPYEKKCYGRI